MDRTHALRLALAALLLGSALVPAHALQLGEGKAQVLQRHGAPGAEDRARDVAIYFWDGWSAELEFKNDTTQKLIFRRNSYLSEAEITSLLRSNGGLDRWKEGTSAEEHTRQWVRDDGATASCLAVRPLMITFQAGAPRSPGVPRYTPEVKPQNVVPPPPAPVATPTPNYPKLLSSALESGKDAVPAAASAPKAFATPEPRALPKLQSEEVATEPPVRQESSPPQPPPQRAKAKVLSPWQLPEAAVDPMDDREAPGASTSALSEASKPGNSGWIAGLVALLAAIAGGGAYWFKKRQPAARFEPVTSKNPPGRQSGVPKMASPASAPASSSSSTAAIDTLRGDQHDILVGEIFRRAGYMVEISAASGQGETIDLTLRRDSETILVQCKHWKSSRVGEKEVRDFHSAMMTNGAPRGIFVTAGSFSREAQDFAAGREIELMDRTALEESIAAVTKPGESFCGITDWIEEFASHSRIFDPACPICQGAMVIRPHRASGASAWTCRNHPRCPGRREPRLDLIAAMAHAY